MADDVAGWGVGRWVQGALWLVAIAAVVALWWFPDAIARLRTLGTPYADASSCDLSRGPCTATFADGATVTLSASPQPSEGGAPVRVVVSVDGTGEPSALEVQGAEMAMGFLHLPLQPDGTDHAVTVDLPVCTTARMKWRADVVLEDRVAGFTLWSTR